MDQGLDGNDLAPFADPDGDQRNNLLEYATGSAAAMPDSTAPITVNSNTGHADFLLQLRADPGLNIVCHLTSDFQTWQTTGLGFDNGQWTTDDPLLQVVDAQAAAGDLWNLTLRHPEVPGALFLQLSVDMQSAP